MTLDDCEWLEWSLYVTVLRSAPFLSVRLFFPCLRFTGIRNQKAVEDSFETYRSKTSGTLTVLMTEYQIQICEETAVTN